MNDRVNQLIDLKRHANQLGMAFMATYTSKEDESFFGAIGRLTISWGHLEFGLDFMVEVFYHTSNGEKIEPEIPRSLQKKISFLRARYLLDTQQSLGIWDYWTASKQPHKNAMTLSTALLSSRKSVAAEQKWCGYFAASKKL